MKSTEQLHKENPGSVFFARYADELAKKGKISEALEILKDGLKNNPYYAHGFYVLSDIYAIQNNGEESEKHLKRALELDPQYPSGLFKLGKYSLRKDPGGAKKYFETALIYEPDFSEIKNMLEKVSPETGLTDKTYSAAKKEQFDTAVPPEPLTEKPGELLKETVISGPEGKVFEDLSTESSESFGGVSDDLLTEDSEKGLSFKNKLPKESPVTEDIAESLLSFQTDAGPEKTGEEQLLEFNEQKEDSTLSDNSEIMLNIDEDSIPGYSDIMKRNSVDLKVQENSGLIELNENENYDLKSLDFSLDEPVLSEEEKNELLSLDKTSGSNEYEREGILSDETGITDDKDSYKYDLADEVSSGDSVTDDSYYNEKSLIENLNALSEEEIDILSKIKSESEMADKELEFETREGIDYSDVLYGHSKINEVFDSSSELSGEADLKDEISDEDKEEIYKALLSEDDISSQDEFDKMFSSLEQEKASAGETVFAETGTEELLEKTDDTAGENIPVPIAAEEPEILSFLEKKPDSVKDDILKDVEIYGGKNGILNVAGTSLEELINDYVEVLKSVGNIKSEENPSELIKNEPEMIPELSVITSEEPVRVSEKKETKKPAKSDDEDPPELGEATATMAEIFVSQGLIARAVEIYGILHEKDPGNEKINTRLSDLQKLLDI